MRALKRDFLSDQLLTEIRQELLEVGLTEIPDEEYVALLTQHTSSLLELVEKLNLKTDSYEGIHSTFSFLFGNLSEPVCIINEHTQVLYSNICWKIKYNHLFERNSKDNYFDEANRDIIHDAIQKYRKGGKRKIITLKIEDSESFISIMPFDGLDKGTCFVLISISNGFTGQVKSKEPSITKQDLPTDSIGEGQFRNTTLSNALIEAIDGFYFILDSELKTRKISSSIRHKLGFKIPDLINKPFFIILSEKSKKEIQEIAARELSFPSEELLQSYRSEIEIIDSNGTVNYYDFTLIFDKKDKVFAGVCIDLYKYKKREEDLINAKMNAELSDQHKTDFLANMSHEIRTPLNGIIGFSTMLGRTNLEKAKRDKYIGIIRTSTMQLLTLVNDIIDISKIEVGELIIHYGKVEINRIFDELQTTFIAEAHRLGKNNIKLVKQTERPRSKIFIRSDEVRLKQVLSNLLGNALKFTCTGKIIYGYSIIKQDTIRFFVKDNGPGISECEQETIFNRYKQSDEGMKDEYRGTGLGLAISKGIVELMGGAIGVRSDSDNGSEFYFTLPLKIYN